MIPEINLLPWRSLLRKKNKKNTAIFWVVIAVFSLSVSCYFMTHQQAQIPLPAAPISRPAPVNPVKPHPTPPTVHFTSFPGTENLSIDADHINVQEALRILTKIMKRNTVISPAVKGIVSLHIQEAAASQLFDLILASQGLTQWYKGNIAFIEPLPERVKQKEEELKLQTVQNESVSLATHIWQIHYAKSEEIAHLIQDNQSSLLSKRGQVRSDSRTNILYIRDIPEHFSQLQKVIARLDVPVQQVLIEAHIASVDSDFERQLGVDFDTHTLVPEEHALPAHEIANVAKGHFSLAVARLADGSLLDVKLSALESDGHGELISSPSLFTVNQQMASIESGEEIPYQEVSRSGATSVSFKKAVLRLQVTPQIMPDANVLLRLQVNQDKPSNRIVLGVPAINTRQLTTNILVKSGQTIVLGGIYESNTESGAQRLPFLGRIPLVGLLFTKQNAIENKRELLIFVTPKIIAQ